VYRRKDDYRFAAAVGCDEAPGVIDGRVDNVVRAPVKHKSEGVLRVAYPLETFNYSYRLPIARAGILALC